MLGYIVAQPALSPGVRADRFVEIHLDPLLKGERRPFMGIGRRVRKDESEAVERGGFYFALEMVVGVDPEAQDGDHFHGLVAAHRGLELPTRQCPHNFCSHIGRARFE